MPSWAMTAVMSVMITPGVSISTRRSRAASIARVGTSALPNESALALSNSSTS